MYVGGHSSGGLVVKNLSCNAGDLGLIPYQGTKIPHAAGQLSPHPLEPLCHTREAVHCNEKLPATKTQLSQIKIFFKMHVMSPSSAATKSLQSCLTPCDPIDGSPPGSPIPGILQARTLEWVAISFSNA